MLQISELTSEYIEPLIQYWLTADSNYLFRMGVDLQKMPSEIDWRNMLNEQIEASYEMKKAYALIWLFDDKPIGHSNINKIEFGNHAFMHLHSWYSENRNKNYGYEFMKLCIPQYFEKFNLKTLYCEPKKENIAPNRMMQKLNFSFVHEYFGIPGWLNYEQNVNVWKLDVDTLNNKN